MAFNPFDFFRRYQKFFFAVLAIVCMFVFILSFGAGDFFTRAQNWFSGPREQGPVVATLYGKTVQESQVRRIQNNRQIATEFLFGTLYAQQEKVSQAQPGAEMRMPKIAADIFKLSRPAVGVLGDVAMGIAGRITAREADLRQVTTTEQLRDMEAKITQDLDQLRNAMLFERTSDGKNVYSNLEADQRAKFDDLLQYLQYERYRTAPVSNYGDLFQGLRAGGANRTYFLGGSRTSEGILDFLVWKNQANKLGIHPTDSAVLRLALTYAGMKNVPLNIPDVAKNEAVINYLSLRTGSNRDRVTVDELMEALRDEVRVELARQAMTGGPAPGTFPDLGLNITPVTATPPTAAEAYASFVKETTTINASLLEIPVEAFRDKVEGKPTEDELKAMFEKYKNDEPTPERSRPAFKEPRRAKVQYLHLSGTSSFIQEQARRTRLIQEAIVPLGLALGAGLTHGSTGSMPFTVPATVEAMHPNSILAEAYDAYKAGRANSLKSWLDTTDEFGNQYGIHDTSWMRVGTTGPLVAFLMSNFHNGTGSPASALAAFGATIHVYEDGDRSWYQRKVMPWVLLSADPHSAFLGAGYLAALQKDGNFPEKVPLKTVGSLFQNFQIENLTERIRGGLMSEAYDLVKGLRGKTEKEAESVLTQFLKDRGIEGALHTTAYAEDVYELPKDPAIKDLIRVVERDRSLLQQDPTGRLVTEFAVRGLALRNRGTYEAFRWGPSYNTEIGRIMQQIPNFPVRQAEEFAGSMVLRQPDAVIIWRTEDRDALVPASLKTLVPGSLEWDREKEVWQQKKPQVEVREKVEAAWNREEAMYLAEKYAQKLREDLKAKNQSAEASLQELRDKKDPRDQKPFELKKLVGIGRLVKRQTPTATDLSYEPGTIPSSVVAQPRPDMVDQLLKGLDAEGATMILSDRPMKHWYLVLCQTRTEPQFDTFLIAQATSPGFYTAHTVPNQENVYQEKLVARLRKEACKDEERISTDGTWTLPSEVRFNFDRSADGGDF